MNEEIKKKKSEKRFRIILENAYDLITIVNERAEYEYLNETAHLKIIGYNREELISKPALEFVHPDDREKAVKELKKAFEIGETSVELRLKSKSGSYVWVDAKSKSFIDQDGKRKILGIARDITDRKKIENSLKKSKQKYKNLFKSIPDGIVTTMLDGKFLSANQAYQNMLGYSLDELKNMDFQSITPEKWREAETEAIKAFMPRGYGTFEKEYIRKDGSIIPISLTAWLIKDEQGNPIKLAGYVEDITERKKVERELKESEEFLKIIIEKAVPPFVIIDFEGNILMVNDSALKFSGYSREEVLKMNASDIALEILPMEHRKNIWERLEFGEQVEVSGTQKRKDGSVFPTETTLVKLKLKDQPVIAAFFRDITERKEEEQKLKVSEEMYRLISENAQDMISLVSSEGKFLYCNEAFKRILGYRPEEIIGISTFKLIHPKDLDKIYNDFKKLNQIGSVKNEARVLCKDGSYKWIESFVKGIRDENNKITKIIGISRDITERKDAEKKIKESEEKYRLLVETINDWIWQVNIEGVYTYASPRVEELLGYKPEEIVGKTPFDLMPPEEAESVGKKFQKIVQSQESFERLENVNLHKDGHYITFETSGMPIFDSNGDLVGYRGVDRNITEKKKAEQKLKESEERFRKIFEEGPLGMAIVNSDYTFAKFNTRFCNMLGYAENELTNIAFQDITHPEDINKDINLAEKLFRGDLPFYNIEKRFIKKNKDILWANLTASIIRDKNGNPIYGIGMVEDITERKKAEEKLKESEIKYRSLYENALVGLWTSKIEGGLFLRANDTAARIAGFDNAEDLMNNCTAIKLFNYETRVEFIRQLKEFGEKSGFEAELTDKNGNKRIVIVSGKINPEKGTIEGSFIDISNMKRAQKELKASEEKYRNLVENSGLSILILDKDGTYLLVNNITAENLGKKPEDIIGKSLFDVLPKDKAEKYLKMTRDVIKSRKGLTTEDIFQLPEGTRTFLINIQPIFDIDGNVTSTQNISLEITKRRRAQQKLKASEEKYRNIIENTMEGYFEVDLKGNFTYFNDALCEISGYTREESQGTSFSKYMTEENSKRTFKVFNSVYNTGIPQKNFQYEFFRKNGTIMYGESSVYLRYDSEGNKIGFSGFMRDVTEKQEAEEKLKESEEKFRTITEQSLLGVTIVQDNKIKYINQQFTDLAGYTIDEAMSLQLKDFYEMIYPEDIKMVMEQFMKKQKGFQDVINHYQYRIIKKTGEIVWLDNFSKTINYMGRPADLITVIDITEQKLAEERLKESEEKYKNMINDLDLGFFQAKWDGTIFNVNPAFRMIMGYSQSEDLIGKKISFFLKNPEEQKKYSEELLKNNIVDNFIIHGQNVHGEELILQTDSHLKRDEEGNPIEIEGTIADITEKFKLEQKLKLSEERYRFLFENSPLAIILSDLKGVIREINPATEELIGYLKKEVIGRSYINLSIVHPDHLPIIQQRFMQHAKGETIPPVDIRFYKKDGSILWANINSNIIKIGNETFLHVMCQDITERKKAELLVKEEIEKLKELDQIRKDLISRVSHELKTPLIPVLGGVEYLLYSYRDKFEKEQIELLEMIQKGGKRLGKLVERLLDITRIEYDKLILKRQLTNLSEIIKETANDMKYLIKERKINLNLVVPDDLFLEIDGMRMEQVITNLLSNALKNTPPKGRVSIGLEKYGNWAIISVSDTGVGFTEDEIKKIFTKFGKIERHGEGLEYINMEGSGLGLYITKQIVDLHGGKIWVESTGRNRGCIFKVRLPII